MALAPGDPRHGTVNGYVNHGCRCAACGDARRAYYSPRRDVQKWRAKQYARGLDARGVRRRVKQA